MSAAFMAACGGSGDAGAPLPPIAPGEPPRRVYVGRVDTIDCFAVDSSTGTLGALRGSTDLSASGGGDTTSLALDTAQRWLFATSSAQVLLGYTVDASSGALTPVPGGPVGTGATFALVHPSGRFVYATLRNAGLAAGFSINASTGSLSAIGAPIATGGTWPTALAFDPAGQFAYVANTVSSNLSVFHVDPVTGGLTLAASRPQPTGLSPQEVVVDPSGRWVYVANSNASSVSGFRVDRASGALAELEGSPFVVTNVANIASLCAHPTGKYLYAADYTGNVLGFSIDAATGRLGLLPGSPLYVGGFPIHLRVSASGSHAYLAQRTDSTIRVLLIDGLNGTLKIAPGMPTATPNGPTSLALVA
jgi:6-phosphogluconolactonase